jgi:predicted DNA-binding transcriptional regulator AlpA
MSQSSIPSSDTSDIAAPVVSLSGFMRLPQVLALVPVSKSTLWRHVLAGAFPAPVKLFVGVTAWRVEDVRTWIEERSGTGLGFENDGRPRRGRMQSERSIASAAKGERTPAAPARW